MPRRVVQSRKGKLPRCGWDCRCKERLSSIETSAFTFLWSSVHRSKCLGHPRRLKRPRRPTRTAVAKPAPGRADFATSPASATIAGFAQASTHGPGSGTRNHRPLRTRSPDFSSAERGDGRTHRGLRHRGPPGPRRARLRSRRSRRRLLPRPRRVDRDHRSRRPRRTERDARPLGAAVHRRDGPLQRPSHPGVGPGRRGQPRRAHPPDRLPAPGGDRGRRRRDHHAGLHPAPRRHHSARVGRRRADRRGPCRGTRCGCSAS